MNQPFRFHEERRAGEGTTFRPIVRIGGLCAVEHCKVYVETHRIAPRSGYVVGYCYDHGREAAELFGA